MKRIVICVLLLMVLGLCVNQPVYAEETAPLAENLEISTFRNASVSGQLSAHDPQGGDLKFILTTEPVKGSIELREDGSFLYTPREGKRGRDYFGYKVEDCEGNLSQEATVIIRIEKPGCDVYYSDMDGRAEEYSAMLLNEKGIFTGSCTNGEYYFEPERQVSRKEFERICHVFDPAGMEAEDRLADTEAEPLTLRDAAMALDALCLRLNGTEAEDKSALMSCAVWNAALSPDYLTRSQLARMLSETGLLA